MSSSIRGKIDRAFDSMLRARQDEESRNKPLVTVDTIEFCKKILDWTPYSYQEKLLRDESRFVVARMSRQSGKSTTLALLALYTALATANSRTIIVAPSLRQAQLMIQKVWTLARKIRRLTQGRPLKRRLDFRNGSQIEALPNSPETIRGQTSNLVLIDEFNFVENDKELYDAVIFSLMTTNGRVIVASTPGSEDSIFYHMCTDNEGPYAKVSRHHVRYHDALEPNGPLKMEVLEQIRDQYQVDPSRWTREMEAEFADEDDRWISRELIMKCVNPNHHYIPDEFYLEGLDETEEGRKLLAAIGRPVRTDNQPQTSDDKTNHL